MISALPHSERSRDAVCVRSRSWRIYKQKHLLAPTQPLTLVSSQAFTEWAEHKDAVCNPGPLQPRTGFCCVPSSAEAVSPYGTASLWAGQLLLCLHELDKGRAPLLRADKPSLVPPSFGAWAPVEFGSTLRCLLPNSSTMKTWLVLVCIRTSKGDFLNNKNQN